MVTDVINVGDQNERVVCASPGKPGKEGVECMYKCEYREAGEGDSKST